METMTGMLAGSPLPPDFFAAFDPLGPLEAAVVFRRNGRVLASWIKNPAAVEVVSVMSATLMGSVDTLLETLRDPGSSLMVIVAERRKIVLQKVEPSSAIVLIAPSDASEAWLREVLGRIMARLPSPPANRSTRGAAYTRGR